FYLVGHGFADGYRATRRYLDLGPWSDVRASWSSKCPAAPDPAVDWHCCYRNCRCSCFFLDLVRSPLLPLVPREARSSRLTLICCYLVGHGFADGYRATRRYLDLGPWSDDRASWSSKRPAAPDPAVDWHCCHRTCRCSCFFLDLVRSPLLPPVPRVDRS